MPTYRINSTVEVKPFLLGDFPSTITAEQYDRLRGAIRVVDALWFIEESHDAFLQNAIDFQTAVARLEAGHRANIVSFPDETDLQVRLLNRLLGNVLSSARALIDMGDARVSETPELGSDSREALKRLLSQEYDAHFSYRLMEVLRNQTQHQQLVITQALAMTRPWQSRDGRIERRLTVHPQIVRDRLIERIKKPKHRAVLSQCEPLIDLMPHLASYVSSFRRVLVGVRDLFGAKLQDAVDAHHAILGSHLTGEWASAWVEPDGDPMRQQMLLCSAHDLRRLERIRLRNWSGHIQEEPGTSG